MDIRRVGHNRNESPKEACKDEKPKVHFDGYFKCMNLSVFNCEGMGQSGRYDYTITLSIEDVGSIIETLAKHPGVFEDGPLRAELKSRSQSLLTLLLGSSDAPWMMPKRSDVRERLGLTSDSKPKE